MKRRILAVIVLLIIAVAFISCKKCVTCTAYYSNTNVQADIDHLCSNTFEVNAWVNDYKTEWDYGVTYAECLKD
jgi:hypothetical protein